MLLQLWLDIKLHVPNNNMGTPPPGLRQSEPITTAIKGCYSRCDWTSNYLIWVYINVWIPPPSQFRQSEPSTTAIKGCCSSCDWTSNYLIVVMDPPPHPRVRKSEPSTAAIKGCYSSCDWTSNYPMWRPPTPSQDLGRHV